MNHPNSQVSGFAQSPSSIFSEAPDIKNWFSSYTYQSPALDSDEDFCISPTRVKEGEYEEDGLCVEDSEIEEEEKCVNMTNIRKAQQLGTGGMSHGYNYLARKLGEEARKDACVPDVEMPAYPDSLSLPSEPPDIANWFSSYVYESPELESADFEVSLLFNHNSGNEKVEKGNDRQSKEPAMKVNAGLLSCSELISSGSNLTAPTTGAEEKRRFSAAEWFLQKDGSKASDFFSEKNIRPEKTSEQSTLGAAIGNCCITPVPCPSVRAENIAPVISERPQTDKADHLMSVAEAPYRKVITEACQYEAKKESKVAENGSGWIQLKRKSRESFCKSSREDEKQYIRAENTSSTRKSNPRLNKENSPQKLGPRGCTINSGRPCEDRKARAVTREVFKETTNTQHRHPQESAGKWSCPQKNKPNPGPPLKQLRLERWVHRI